MNNNMAEEQKITYDDWLNAYKEFAEYKQHAEKLADIAHTARAAAKVVHDLDPDPEAIESIVKNAPGLEYLPAIELGQKKSGKKLRELSSRKNLEAILGSIEGDIVKKSLDRYLPEKLDSIPDNYKKAVDLHKRIFELKGMRQYFHSGKIDREIEEALKGVTLQMLAEHYEEQYPKSKDKEENEENELIKHALLAIADRNEEYRKTKFQKLAPKIIAKKEKEFYTEIGGEKNITTYLKCVLAEDEIFKYYTLLAQIKEQKDAQKAQAEQQQRLNHDESAYRRAA